MPEVTLLDTGPLVALLDKEEEHHNWAIESMRGVRPPLLICEGVLTEACFLLRNLPRARLQMRLWVQSGYIHHAALDQSRLLRAFALMERYANVPMSFADACLVALAESTPGVRLFTLDQDFLIYRQRDDKLLPLLAPFAR